MQTTRETIESGWRVRELIPGTMEPGKVDWIPAQVPGHVHLDLMRAGVIADPFYRMQERSCAWVDEADWEYETTFEGPDPAPPRAYLRFNGLDTIAEIYLNGVLLAETDNMFVEHEFAVGTENGKRNAENESNSAESDSPERPVLAPGTNTLRVIFRSALRIGRDRQAAWVDAQHLTPNAQYLSPHWFAFGPRSFVRKAQYMYGWDWGPELISCGIWKPVDLKIDDSNGDSGVVSKGPAGAAPRVTLDRDVDGMGFRFLQDGEPLFIKGANWIPAHSFPSKSSEEVKRLLTAAHAVGINMLRVWGGGIYESDEFYNLCDQLGILVWQDFPYACAYYPDTEEYAAKAELEARAAVRRLRNHPSLAVWCGNNECHQVWHDHWEGKENPSPRFLGEKFYHEILPRVVAEEDPGRPYWPGSPFGGADPNSEDEGDRHNWNVWHGAGDWIHYREDRGRFISEFGFASSCGLHAWDKCLADTDKHPHSPAVRWHDKTRKGYENYLNLVKLHFPEPVTLEDLVYYTQLNQAEALKCGIEHWRRSKGRCWGAIFWQLNDCWPAHSWSVIDSELEPKAAYYAVKRAYAPVLLSLRREGDSVEAHLTSDLMEQIQGDVTISVESFDGDVLMDEKFEAFVEANGAGMIGALDVSSFKLHARDVYVYARFEPYWDLGIPEVENHLFLAEPKDLRLPDPGITAEIAEITEGFHLILNTQRFAPYVWWRFDGIRAPFANDNHFHLHAGQSRTIQFECDGASIEELRATLRIRSL